MNKKAILKFEFSIVQWFGDTYPYYEEDSRGNHFKENEEVEILKIINTNNVEKAIIYSDRIQQCAVVRVDFLQFL